jgi:hypothetical protein
VKTVDMKQVIVKKKQLLGILLVLLAVLLSYIYINKIHRKPLTYINAIDKVYSSNINGMVFNIFRTNNLYGRKAEILFVGGGTKENDFSAYSKEGVKLWETKQLFSSIKNLKTLRVELPEKFEPQQNGYYMIQTNQDFYGKDDNQGIWQLALYVNPKNYHIYIPKDYYEPSKLQEITTEYIEYESNEITKKLITDIITE